MLITFFIQHLLTFLVLGHVFTFLPFITFFVLSAAFLHLCLRQTERHCFVLHFQGACIGLFCASAVTPVIKDTLMRSLMMVSSIWIRPRAPRRRQSTVTSRQLTPTTTKRIGTRLRCLGCVLRFPSTDRAKLRSPSELVRLRLGLEFSCFVIRMLGCTRTPATKPMLLVTFVFCSGGHFVKLRFSAVWYVYAKTVGVRIRGSSWDWVCLTGAKLTVNRYTWAVCAHSRPTALCNGGIAGGLG